MLTSSVCELLLTVLFNVNIELDFVVHIYSDRL